MERNLTDLPASVVGQSRDLHAIGCSARAGSGALVSATKGFPLTVSAGELNGEAFSHEVGSVLIQSVRISEGCSQGHGSWRRGRCQAGGDERANVRKAWARRLVSNDTSIRRVFELLHLRVGAPLSLTWNHVSGIHGVLIFDKTEAVHELDLGNLASAMLGEVGFDVGLGGYSGGILVSGILYASARGAARAPAGSIHSSGMAPVRRD